MKTFYHVTRVENIDSIVLNGLKANEEGDVFLYEEYPLTELGRLSLNASTVGESIAKNQLFIADKYAVFTVKAREKDLVKDNVAESTSTIQHINKGNIPSNRVKFQGIRFYTNPNKGLTNDEICEKLREIYRNKQRQ